MGGQGRARHCDCLLCGHPGKLIEEHEWKEHMRQLRMAKRDRDDNGNTQNASSRMMFGLAVNDQLGRERLEESPLWGSAQQNETSLDSPFVDDFGFDPEGLTAALSHLSPVPRKSRDFMITLREKKNSLQRKMDRALSHISHHRNMKKLENAQCTVVSLEARFKQGKEKVQVHQFIDELEARLSSVTLEANSVRGRTPPVEKLRNEINESIDGLTLKFRNWRLENNAVLPSQPAIYDMGTSIHYFKLLCF